MSYLAGAAIRGGGAVLAGDDTGKASPIGLLVIILLCAACYFLYRSMSRHLRNVRDDFPGQERPTPSGGNATTSVDTSTRSPDGAITSTADAADDQPAPTASAAPVPAASGAREPAATTPFVPPVRPTYAVHREGDEPPDRDQHS